MATKPEDRQLAIDAMTRILLDGGADTDTARKGATALVDMAIRDGDS